MSIIKFVTDYHSVDLTERIILPLSQEVRIDKQLKSGLRVTVQLNKTQKNGNVCPSNFDLFNVL